MFIHCVQLKGSSYLGKNQQKTVESIKTLQICDYEFSRLFNDGGGWREDLPIVVVLAHKENMTKHHLYTQVSINQFLFYVVFCAMFALKPR